MSPEREKLFSVTLSDCDLETFHAGGPGGQAQNKSDTGVRIRHRASGAVGESRETRSQLQNKHAAWNRMINSGKFKVWLSQKIFLDGRSPEEEVKRLMRPENLKVEAFDGENWRIIG